MNERIDIGTAAIPISDDMAIHNPNVVKVVTARNGRALYFSRAAIPFVRDRNETMSSGSYLKHIGIYAFRSHALERFASLAPSPLEQKENLEQLRALENDMYIHVAIVERDSIAVDSPDDVRRVVDAMKKDLIQGTHAS
jgi:3-deoxy-manno-octulosonate cytidylyltransferase (CMP-KDO synthetase)